MDGRVLILDDDRTLLEVLQENLERVGFVVTTASTVDGAKEQLQNDDFDLAVVDLHLEDESGLELLEWMSQKSQAVAVVLSGNSSLEEAVSAVRQNAFDFVLKPVVDYNLFFQRLQRAIDYKRVVQSRDKLLLQLREKTTELASRLEQLSLAHKTLKAHAMAVQRDLNRARTIQQRMLPRSIPFKDRVSLSALYMPAGKVGGDLFDVFAIDERRLGLYVADVSGHGISSAMLTVFLKDAVHALDRENDAAFLARADMLLTELNRMVFKDLGCFDMFISMTYLVFDVESYEMTFSNAGHPPLILKSKGQGVRDVHLQAPALGIDSKANFGRGTIQLQQGDLVVLYTDGIREAHDDRGNFYGVSALKEKLEKTFCHADIMAAECEKDLLSFCKDHPIPDDVTLLVLGAEPQRVPFMTSEADCEADQEQNEGPMENCEFFVSSKSGRLFIKLRGSGTWKEGKEFRQIVEEGVNENIWSVVISLRECSHMDSTFLGILHDLVKRFDSKPGCEIEVQEIQRPLLKEMSELGLTSVLNHVRHRPIAFPDFQCKLSETLPLSQEEMGRMLLSAHESLVEADPRNADRFNAVLEVLHKQAAKGKD